MLGRFRTHFIDVRLRIVVLLVLVGNFPAGLEAQAPGAVRFGARAEVEVPIAASHAADPTASGTAVPLHNRVEPGESLQEVLRDVPGARPFASGGLGSFSSLTLRGAESAHTSVLIGNIPLSGPDRGPFDLSLMPIAGLDRVEVFRGGAPLQWSDGAIGGVLRLVPRGRRTDGERRLFGTLSLQGGSFGRLGSQANAAIETRDAAAFANVSLRHANNDFTFLDDNGTRFVREDDRQRQRRNAQALASDQLLSVKVAAGGGELALLWLSTSRLQGEPGPASAPAPNTNRQLHRGLAAISYDITEEGEVPWRLQASVSGAYEQNAVDDRLGEIGNAAEFTRDRTLGFFARLAGGFEPLGWLEISAVSTVRLDRYDPKNQLAPELDAASTRFTGAFAAELRFHGNVDALRWELRPSIRVAHSDAQIVRNDFAGETKLARQETFPTVRLGALVSPVPWLTFAASAATGGRIPSILELFGNRVTLLANPDLRDERSQSFDLGVTAKPVLGPLRSTIELRGFWLELEDLIRYRRTAQFTAIAENVAEGRVRGMELGVQSNIADVVTLRGALSVLDTDAGDGFELPLRPRWLGHAQVEVTARRMMEHWDSVVFFASVDHTGANFIDPANLVELESRSWFSLGARSRFAKRVDVSFVIRDLFDRRGTDLLGFPLPGRRWFLELAYRFGSTKND